MNNKVIVTFPVLLTLFFCGCISQSIETAPAPVINSLDELMPYTRVCENQFLLYNSSSSYGNSYVIYCVKNITLKGREEEYHEKGIFFGYLTEDFSLSKRIVFAQVALGPKIAIETYEIYPLDEKLQLHEKDGVKYLTGEDKPYNIYLCGQCRNGDRLLVLESTRRFTGIEPSSVDVSIFPQTGEDLINFLNLGK